MDIVRSNWKYILLGVSLVFAIGIVYLSVSCPEQRAAQETSFPSLSSDVVEVLPTFTASPQVEESPVSEEKPISIREDYQIITLLPKDAIPAIDEPRFYPAQEADAEYELTEMVLGVSINGESRAYSTSLLDSHEIVNDEVGGFKIAVTW